MWKRLVIRTAEAFTFTPSSRRQSFMIRASCEIENSQNREEQFSVVIPIPQRTPAQIFDEEVVWTDVGIEVQKDELYGNTCGVWSGRIGGNQKKKCGYTVRLTVAPFWTSAKKERTENLQESLHIRTSDARIQKIVQKLSFDNPAPLKYARRAYEYVLSHLVYGKPIEGLYTATDALDRREVDCGGFSTLFASLLLTGGIPARVVSGFFAPSGGKNSMHAWVEACTVPDQWMPFDPSAEYLFRKGRTLHRSGRFGFVGSDHVVYSYGCDLTVAHQGKKYQIPLLQNPFFLAPSSGVALSSSTVITTS